MEKMCGSTKCLTALSLMLMPHNYQIHVSFDAAMPRIGWDMHGYGRDTNFTYKN